MTNEINKIQISMEGFSKDISFIKEAVSQHTMEQKELKEKIDHFCDTFQSKMQDKADQKELVEAIKSLDERYAPRLTWSILVWGGSIIGGAILLGAITFIAKLYKTF